MQLSGVNTTQLKRAKEDTVEFIVESPKLCNAM